MALSEKKIDIAECYLSMKGKNLSQAVKEIDPTIKAPGSYAWKLLREIEFKEYLASRRKEILMDCGLDTITVVKGLTKNFYESLGLMERIVLGHGKNGFIETKGMYPDSTSAKNYWSILKDILGSEISAIQEAEDIERAGTQLQREHAMVIDKKRLSLDIEKHKGKDGKVKKKVNIKPRRG